MKKIYSLLTILIMSSLGFSQTMIRTVGIGGNYPTLSAAFADINEGEIVGDIELQIISNITETTTTTTQLKKSLSGLAEYNSITIYPTEENVVLDFGTSVNNFQFFNIQSNNLTIDGRLNKTGAPNNLTFNTFGGTSILFMFTNKAEHNKIQYCNISSTGTPEKNAGIISFYNYGGDTLLANKFNSIKYNHIYSLDQSVSTIVANKIYFSEYNYADTIEGNHFIRNNFKKHITSDEKSSIRMINNNHGHVIKGNSFYDTDTIVIQSSSIGNHYIKISNGVAISDPNYHYEFNLVDSNFFGGTQAYAAGNPMVINGQGTYGIGFEPIFVSGRAHVTNNVIKNISFINSNINNAKFKMIVFDGNYFVNANILNNKIGGTSLNDKIYIENNGDSTLVAGIVISYGNMNIENNSIKNIQIKTANNGGANFAAIQKVIKGSGSTGSPNIANNIIGGTTEIEKIKVINGIVTNLTRVVGIDVHVGERVKINNNLITGLYDSTKVFTTISNLGGVMGIRIAGNTNTVIENNYITNLISFNENVAINMTSATGIALAGTGMQKCFIRNNEISHIKAMSTFAYSNNVAGIYCWMNPGSMVSDSSVVSNNYIHNIRNHSTNDSAITSGIFFSSYYQDALRKIYNNVIVIDNLPNPHHAYGIGSGTVGTPSTRVSAQHNTIYIDGGENTKQTSAILNIHNVQNNILANVSSRSDDIKRHHGIIHQSTDISSTISNNNFYYLPNPGTRMARGAADAYNTVASLQSAISSDLYSYLGDPSFVNEGGTLATDYIATNGVITAPITGINNDFMEVPRVSYYMGAFESLEAPLSNENIKMNLHLNHHNKVQIKWTIDNFEEIEYYTVLSSNDAKNWTSLENISNLGFNQYEIIDPSILDRKRYYQIQVVYNNGRSKTYPAQWIDVSNVDMNISLFPNPAQRSIQLNTGGKILDNIQIIDIQGRNVYDQSNYEHLSIISLRDLSKGNYFMKVIDNNQVEVIPFVIQ